MLLFGEILKLKETDYKPILMNTIFDNNKKNQQSKNINKNIKSNNNEIRKIEKQCGLLW